MKKRFYVTLISLAALVSAANIHASARLDGHHQQVRQHAAKRRHEHAPGTRQRARARRRNQRRSVAYVCPMHPDIRERARGTCPKCLMELVAAPRDVKASRAGTAAPGGM